MRPDASTAPTHPCGCRSAGPALQDLQKQIDHLRAEVAYLTGLAAQLEDATRRVVRQAERRGAGARVAPLPPDLREALFDRDGHRCRYCGVALNRANRCLDHVVPTSGGGANNATNLVAACHACNRAKGKRTLAEAGMTLRRRTRRSVPKP